MNSVLRANSRAHQCCACIENDPLRQARAESLALLAASQWPGDLKLDFECHRLFGEAGWTRGEVQQAVNDLVASGRAILRPDDDGTLDVVVTDRKLIEQTFAWRSWREGLQEGTQDEAEAASGPQGGWETLAWLRRL